MSVEAEITTKQDSKGRESEGPMNQRFMFDEGCTIVLMQWDMWDKWAKRLMNVL